jgi:class 3 adenylate cyclase
VETALKEHLQREFAPSIATHHGAIVKNTGYGMLAEFGSVVEQCAALLMFNAR